MSFSSSCQHIPRLPVFGWNTLRGSAIHSIPSVLDAPHRRLTVNGRSAIALALQVLNIQPGETVLVPTYHCPTMVAPITARGVVPLFYPINEQGDPDLEWLEKNITPQVSAMLCAHFFGIPHPLAKVHAFCVAHGITLIEDCAHALFGRSDGRPIGQWGDIAIASLTKFLPLQEGGVIASATRPLDQLTLRKRGGITELKGWLDQIEIASHYRRLTGLNTLFNGVFALKRLLNGSSTSLNTTTTVSDEKPQPASDYGFDSKNIDLQLNQASRWITSMTLREPVITGRRRNFMRLVELMSDLPGARPLIKTLPDDAAPYVFPLIVDNAEPRYRALRRTGLSLARWEWLWPGTPHIPGDHGLIWAQQIFQLPCHQELDEQALQLIANAVREVCQANP